MTTTLLTRYRTPRLVEVRNIVVHVNVGPERVRAADSVARYTQLADGQRDGSRGGYHEIVDDAFVVITARDNEVVNGAAGANEYGWHICLVGYADQTADEWADRYSLAELGRAALRVAAACKRFGVPARKLDGAALRNGERGVCGHVDVRDAFHNTTHYDPGPHFPWAQFMTLVRVALGEQQQPEQEDDDVTAMIVPDKPMRVPAEFKGKRPTFEVAPPGVARQLTQPEVDFKVKLGKEPAPAPMPREFVEGLHFIERGDGR